MKKTLFLLFAFLMFTACSNDGLTSQQSIHEILEKEKTYETVMNETKDVMVVEEVNLTEANETEEPEEDMTLRINKKCRNSVILYDGCKWKNEAQEEFTLKIVSASKSSIMGTWFFFYGVNGTLKTEKRTGEILSEGRKSYEVNYKEVADEIGEVTRIEILPIEIVVDLEYACENQKVYTIPKTYCKPSEPVSLD